MSIAPGVGGAASRARWAARRGRQSLAVCVYLGNCKWAEASCCRLKFVLPVSVESIRGSGAGKKSAPKENIASVPRQGRCNTHSGLGWEIWIEKVKPCTMIAVKYSSQCFLLLFVQHLFESWKVNLFRTCINFFWKFSYISSLCENLPQR